MASSTLKRWLRPEVYPLFAAVGVAVGICGFQLVRNICINPEVRVNKEGRAAGVLDNHAEGEKYAEHGLRKFVRNRNPEIMPAINSFFTNPETE
ncbi:B12d protein [Musa troglodytarum]|uniref:B12d protein n=1 Tax=Musa troglodytarum TaxID=320322 RepID=A0A9E7EFX3_9LILI|nr:B12d protein [Musa troglodytarum]